MRLVPALSSNSRIRCSWAKANVDMETSSPQEVEREAPCESQDTSQGAEHSDSRGG